MAKTLVDFKAKHDPATIIAALTADLAAARSELGLQRVITEVLGNVSAQLETLHAPKWTQSVPSKGAPGAPTLFLSDIHAGEVVVPEQINGVNSFNMSILAKRLQHTVKTAIELCAILDHDMRYPGIVLPLGGDMVSGDIHEELQATNELPTIPTVLELVELLASAIELLLTVFDSVFVPCVSGNHGRNTKKTWAKNRNHTSFDWLTYQILARHFRGNPRVVFYIPAGSDALYRIYNKRFLLTHGDQFKSGDSIIGPIGPVFRGRQKKLSRNQAVDQGFDVMMLGHWHTYIQTELLIVNGSVKGYDEYAAAGNFGFEPPQQALFITHPRVGITFRMPVLCEPPPKVPVASSWVSVLK